MFFAILYVLPKKIKCTFTVFVHNSITKYYWQNFAKPLQRCLEKPLLFSMFSSSEWRVQCFVLFPRQFLRSKIVCHTFQIQIKLVFKHKQTSSFICVQNLSFNIHDYTCHCVKLSLSFKLFCKSV